ncbi:very long chain fatty acid elongase 4-like isoform X2 [Planococcus citri]|uniref:very long chain fatty acid elongase 4-like isoform X2 n=1 Tax=Planococcus citri TaxID=170843 RepID=UPI0031F8D9A9
MAGKLEFINRGVVPEEENLFLLASKEVDKWFLMESPWPVLSIVLSYLLFVIKVGPEVMKNRKPFNIKTIMLIYNLYQTISNAYIVSLLFVTKGAINYIWKHGCHPMDPAINPFWPAAFFILRKKQSHVTFLHVYHHANMVVSTWAYLKYIKGEQGVIVGVINSSVHVVMYGYYFLSALGPEMQKYLWWKRYITRMQMVQFVIIIVYMATLLVASCQVPRALSFFIILQGTTFFVLFANFYVQTYIVKGKSKSKSKPATVVANGNAGIHVSPVDKVK